MPQDQHSINAVMFFSYLKNFLQRTSRQKGYVLLNVLGLAIGMAACFLILMWIHHELSFDRFHAHADRLFRVITEQHQSGQISLSAETQYPLAPSIKSDFPEVADACRLLTKWGDMFIQNNASSFVEDRVLCADASFLNMFSFPLRMGNPETALVDPYSIVLTEEIAEKYFGEVNPIDKILKIDYNQELLDFRVTGILRKIPEYSHLQFDFLLPFSLFEPLYADVSNLWDTVDNYSTYVLLQKNISYEDFNNKISNYKTRHIPQNFDRLYLQPVTSIHLYSDVKFDSPSSSNYRYVNLFSAIAVFIIIIACINYINLSTARSEKRAKEVGLRKVFGADRRHLITLFFLDAFIQAFLALVCSLIIVYFTLPLFNTLSGRNLSVSEYRHIGYIALLVGFAFVIGVLSGSYPSFYLSSFRPVQVLKGLAGTQKTHLRGSLLRRSLVLLQFSLSISLIVCTIGVSNQLQYLRSKDLGYDQQNILEIPVRGDLARRYQALKSELLELPAVRSVTAANILPTQGNESLLEEWEGNIDQDRIIVNITSVDYDYFETMNMKISKGRSFSRSYPSDLTQAVIINEETVRRTGMVSPIGKKIWDRNIIGVVQDYHYKSLHEPIEPIVLFLTDRYFYHILLRTNLSNQALNNVERIYQRFVSDYPFAYNILDRDIARFYDNEARTYNLFAFFMVLAIFIACLGLFSLVAFLSEQRSKEIGIRKVLGASATSIVSLLTAEYTKLVLIANIISWPIAWYAMTHWLQNFAYRAPLGWQPFVLAGTAAFLVAVITVGYLSLKAAGTNPVDVILHD